MKALKVFALIVVHFFTAAYSYVFLNFLMTKFPEDKTTLLLPNFFFIGILGLLEFSVIISLVISCIYTITKITSNGKDCNEEDSSYDNWPGMGL